MRVAFAIVTAVLVLLSAAAPHHHGGPFGSHECAACVARSGEAACAQTPDVAPGAACAGEPEPLVSKFVAVGAPLGAIPGQSPPPA